MSKDLKNRDRSKKHQMQSESSYFDKEEKNVRYITLFLILLLN